MDQRAERSKKQHLTPCQVQMEMELGSGRQGGEESIGKEGNQ